MGLLSYFKRPPDADPAAAAPAPAPAEADAVAAARARARRRLLGATVLLGLGVIGFPLLFETQPRPIPVDIPIEIPRKDAGAPLLLQPAAPLARASAAGVDEGPALSAAVQGATERAGAAPAEIVEQAKDQGRDLSSPANKPPVVPSPPVKPAPPPVAAAPAPAPAPAKPADDGSRAQALLDGQPTSAAAAAPATASNPATRVVVQVGAYTDPTKLAEARRKLEALGFKTYTQVVESDAGPRTRVRVGPFASRAEADKAAARVKSAGLPAAILSL